MKFELRCLAEYSRQSIIAELRRVADIITHQFITTREFKKHARIGIKAVNNHLGSWQNALEQAGLEHRFNLTSRYKTNEELLSELRRVARKKRSRTIKIRDLGLIGSIFPGVLRRRFGSWKKALAAANLRPAKYGTRYTDDECFANLLRVWTHYERKPSYSEMRHPHSRISASVYAKRFGSWRKALQAFVEWVNRKKQSRADPEKRPVPEAAVVKTRPLTKRELRRHIPLGLRFWILKRDRFRCRLCGNSPAIDAKCRLHVDHIRPFSKGGRTQAENLRALCANCNIGKGNRETI